MNAKHILFKMTENKMNLANNKILSVKKKGGSLNFLFKYKEIRFNITIALI